MPINPAPPAISQSVGMFGTQESSSFCALLLPINEGEHRTPFFSRSKLRTRDSSLRPPDRARIIEVKCNPTTSATRQSCPAPLINSYFPESTPASLILTQGLNQEPLRFPLQVWYCPVSMARASPPNKAVHRITSGQMRKTWCVSCSDFFAFQLLTIYAGVDQWSSSNTLDPVVRPTATQLLMIWGLCLPTSFLSPEFPSNQVSIPLP